MADLTAPPSDQEKQVLGFIGEAIDEGDAFVRSQEGYDKIGECMDMIMGKSRDVRSSTLSSTTCNRFGKNFADLSALQTDVKPFWEYRTYNRRFEPSQVILGKLATAWYTGQQIDMRFGDVVKYANVGGTSYANLFWNEETQDPDCQGEDPRDVLPIRPGSGYESVQNCFGVAVRRSCSVNYLRRKYPSKADQIVPDRDGSYRTSLQNTRAGRLLEQMSQYSPFRMRLFGKEPAKEMPKIPTVDLHTIYLKDNSRNEKSYPIEMGEFEDGKALNNWSYIVEPGELRYPRGRMLVATRTAVLYDGPNIYWHGKFPLPKLTLQPMPWTWLGKAALWDNIPLQRSYDKVLRIIEDHLDQIARPGVIADKNSTSKAMLDRLDTRRAGWKIQQNPLAGKGIQVVPPPPLPSEVFNHRDWLPDQMDELSGVRDMSQMMRLNQMPSAETMEKLIESMTASVRAQSRVIEAFMREFAMMMAFNFAQFYTLPKRLTILGPSGVTPEDFDYDPGSLIPDFVHSKDYDERGMLSRDALERGPMPRYDRAVEWMRQFTFHIAPGSLLAASEIEQKLLYMNLFRMGVIDMFTLAEILGIPKFGNPPDGADTVIARLQWQQQNGLGPSGNAAGRPQSGNTLPRMVTKTS